MTSLLPSFLSVAFRSHYHYPTTTTTTTTTKTMLLMMMMRQQQRQQQCIRRRMMVITTSTTTSTTPTTIAVFDTYDRNEFNGTIVPSPSLSPSSSSSSSIIESLHKSVRLNKYLVQHHYAMSRRDADLYIQNGWILVNGKVVTPKDIGKQIVFINDDPSLSSTSTSSLSSSSTTTTKADTAAYWVNPVVDVLPCATYFQQKCRSTTVILNKPLGILSGLYGNSIQKSKYIPAIQLLTHSNQYHRYPTSVLQKNHSSLQRQGQPEVNHDNNYNMPLEYMEGISEISEERSTQQQDQSQQQLQQRPEPYRLSKLAVTGRLDINTTGLLLFTQDGQLASHIIGPKSNIEKEYLVRINNNNNNNNNMDTTTETETTAFEELQETVERLRRGIKCGGDFLKAKSVEILHSTNQSAQLRIILTQGKKHHIRRMIENGSSSTNNMYQIQALKRVRIGSIILGSLPTGKWRYLYLNEQNSMYKSFK